MNHRPTLETMSFAVAAKDKRPRRQLTIRMQRVMAPFFLFALLLHVNYDGVFAWSTSPLLLNSRSTCFRTTATTTTIGGPLQASRQSQKRLQARATITPCLVSLVSTTDSVETTATTSTSMEAAAAAAATPEPSSSAITTTTTAATTTTTFTTDMLSDEAVATGTQATMAEAAQEQQQQQQQESSLLLSFTNSNNNWKEMFGINNILMPSSASSSANNNSNIVFNLDSEQIRKAVNLLLLTASFGFALYQILNIDHGMTRGWTQSEIAMRIPMDTWAGYETALEDKPVATKTMINVVIYLLGDWLSQTVFQKRNVLDFDAKRTLRNGFIGLCFGPLVHAYYEFSDTILPLTDGDLWTRGEKILMDQTIYLAVKCSIYVAAVSMLQGDSFETAKDNVKNRLPNIVVTAWKFWPLVHCLTYSVIPSRHRILWVNMIDLIWNAILASMASKKEPIPDETAALTAAQAEATVPMTLTTEDSSSALLEGIVMNDKEQQPDDVLVLAGQHDEKQLQQAEIDDDSLILEQQTQKSEQLENKEQENNYIVLVQVVVSQEETPRGGGAVSMGGGPTSGNATMAVA